MRLDVVVVVFDVVSSVDVETVVDDVVAGVYFVVHVAVVDIDVGVDADVGVDVGVDVVAVVVVVAGVVWLAGKFGCVGSGWGLEGEEAEAESLCGGPDICLIGSLNVGVVVVKGGCCCC